MAGANFVLSTTGYLDGALLQSYSKVALDGEQLEMMYRLGKGVDFDSLDGALDAMREVPPGGHHLGTSHTLENFQSAFFMGDLMNADSFEQWTVDGAKDAGQRGADKAKELLARWEEPALDPAIAAELREFVDRRCSEISPLVS